MLHATSPIFCVPRYAYEDRLDPGWYAENCCGSGLTRRLPQTTKDSLHRDGDAPVLLSCPRLLLPNFPQRHHEQDARMAPCTPRPPHAVGGFSCGFIQWCQLGGAPRVSEEAILRLLRAAAASSPAAARTKGWLLWAVARHGGAKQAAREEPLHVIWWTGVSHRPFAAAHATQESCQCDPCRLLFFIAPT
jgi:hypothetical protein